jgi:hypothetical protein
MLHPKEMVEVGLHLPDLAAEKLTEAVDLHHSVREEAVVPVAVVDQAVVADPEAADHHSS